MDEMFLIGMTLKDAKEVLKNDGINEYRVVVTAPPRRRNAVVNDNFRVLMVYPEYSPFTLIVSEA
ncbi:hypothetical protein Cst_c13670 [Thermoclostridium stercorarium subsp. stercorarium DSM 8532]|jgi:hypothetical protein|uniref:Uncharacterized protein n=3 Tax=Thermoclostridium stercorarium TaxID=1510 RepID=L7VS07_THES1|nr:hypothetical protein [Thermoclostridium stercorarium]AGC68358.1 hypothetical protein Cst_c13670 [Thermoclostridium stercorarium subsp. stercorarium DSM 8532]AGI39381.1 hypothetical protein Clst_1320 [Thermoclostridium stercorarium subsp. stercorarium DSM 8532]ANW98699.1 hypothetical protein CSTERTH_06480 [Thermoclostridium stercorarium subsp. thermolacticum DSM 2910]ANX01240.1 hypothetical protein CSTERLE_06490 [Thermoclostridium stercorarium subsp. leptospartum DSM 9219]